MGSNSVLETSLIGPSNFRCKMVFGSSSKGSSENSDKKPIKPKMKMIVKIKLLRPRDKKISENFLKKFKILLSKNDLNFIVIIPPVYLNNSTSNEDINMIKKVFDDKVFNFSIDSIMNNKYLFKDYSHFNEKFGNFIYKKIDL